MFTNVFSVMGKSSLIKLVFLLQTSVLYGISKQVNNLSQEYKNLSDTEDTALLGKLLSEYYQKLEETYSTKDAQKRDKGNLWALAIHTWLGPKHDTTVHYRLIQEAFAGNTNVCKENEQCKIMDAGCGMGAAMLYFGKLGWDIQGFTLAEIQYNFIKSHFPKLSVNLSSYNDLPAGVQYSGIYAIESLWYSDWSYTLIVWGNHLQYGSRVVIIDDFAVNQSLATNDPDIRGYVEGWMLKAITAVDNLCLFARLHANLRCVQRRDLTEEFDMNKNKYMKQGHSKQKFQAYTGSYYRKKCSINGILIYTLVCLEKF